MWRTFLLPRVLRLEHHHFPEDLRSPRLADQLSRRSGSRTVAAEWFFFAAYPERSLWTASYRRGRPLSTVSLATYALPPRRPRHLRVVRTSSPLGVGGIDPLGALKMSVVHEDGKNQDGKMYEKPVRSSCRCVMSCTGCRGECVVDLRPRRMRQRRRTIENEDLTITMQPTHLNKNDPLFQNSPA